MPEIKKMQPACKPGSVFRSIGMSVIYLDAPSPVRSCGLPPGIGRAALLRRCTWPYNPLDVQPCVLLHKRWAFTSPFHPYRAIEHGGYFLLRYLTLAN